MLADSIIELITNAKGGKVIISTTSLNKICWVFDTIFSNKDGKI